MADPASNRLDRIVVGAALNQFDDPVLTAAWTEATRRVATLHVVHALEITDDDLRHGEASAVALRRSVRQARVDTARAALRQAVSRVAASAGRGVPVTYQVEPGDPATLLLGAARAASLLVAGVRSGGRGSPLLLGTVSQDVAVHTLCPVLLIPVPALG